MAAKRTDVGAPERAGAMRRRDFFAIMGAGAAGLFARGLYTAGGGATGALVGAPQPNIIVILADDQGYADLGCQGAKDVATPHIDSLAAGGVRFTNGYVSGPVCSPTRAGLMTGRYQQRFGHEFNPGRSAAAYETVGLPLSQITIADALKQAGYATGIVGKWHLGWAPKFHPLRRGFDELFGFLGGSHSYLDAKADPLDPILRGTEAVDEKEYLTDAFTREAVSFISRHKDHPFFLYLAYNAVHAPLQATEKYLGRFAHIADPKRSTYAAMLAAMDDGAGAVLRRLREDGLERDTMVFFFSDNGGPIGVNGSDNSPLSGAKGTVLEGGIRVPFILQWPERVPAGKVYDEPVISLDVFPTAVAAARGGVPRDRVMDGVDIIPYVTGAAKGRPHETLFWRSGEQRAVRRGQWKLVRAAGAPPALYDLSRDIGERQDLAKDQPQLAQELDQALGKWESQLAPPLWGRPAQPAGRRRQRAPAASRP